jgi:carbon-monoxide dehydrogenase small subunit
LRISFTLNGKDVTVDSSPHARLIHVLRDEFGLVGAKEGCLQGFCGYCLVVLNGELVPSCMTPVFSAFRGTVLTIEGFRETPDYRDIEEAFLAEGVAPCGFCASAKILTTHVLLVENPNPSEGQIRMALSGVLCRCTSHSAMVEGVKAAALNRRLRSHDRKV